MKQISDSEVIEMVDKITDDLGDDLNDIFRGLSGDDMIVYDDLVDPRFLPEWVISSFSSNIFGIFCGVYSCKYEFNFFLHSIKVRSFSSFYRLLWEEDFIHLHGKEKLQKQLEVCQRYLEKEIPKAVCSYDKRYLQAFESCIKTKGAKNVFFDKEDINVELPDKINIVNVDESTNEKQIKTNDFITMLERKSPIYDDS